MVNNI